MVEGLTTKILPTNEATLPTFTSSASNHENNIHKMTKYCSTTNILSPENYPLYDNSRNYSRTNPIVSKWEQLPLNFVKVFLSSYNYIILFIHNHISLTCAYSWDSLHALSIMTELIVRSKKKCVSKQSS